MTRPAAARPFDPQGTDKKALTADLTVLCTTDLHMQILPYDYLADRAADMPSLARLVPMIRRLRSEAANSLLFDCGDFLQGGPMGDLFGADADQPAQAGPHPMIAAMNAVGYDAVALGNHEFNYGLGVLERAVQQAQFPVVSCNLILQRGGDPTRDMGVTRPFALLERRLTARDGSLHDIRVGVLGLAPPQTVHWEEARLEGRVEARPLAEAAQAWVPELQARGAEVIVMLAHIGPGTEADDATLLAIAGIPGIDAICMGHVHGAFPGPAFARLRGADIQRGTLGGRPAVMAGHGGSHVGKIELVLQRTPSGWKVEDGGARLVTVAALDSGGLGTLVAPGCAVRRAAARAHARTLHHIRTPVGTTTALIDSHFAALGDSPAQRLVGAAMRHWLINGVADPPPASMPVLAAVPAFRAGGIAGPNSYTDIAAGALAMRHLHDLYPFSNILVALRLTGAEVVDWLERVASLYDQACGDTERTLLLPSVPAWNLDVMDGLDYAFDLSRPARFRPDGAPSGARLPRVIAPQHGGKPLDPTAEFVVVTSAHRAAGGGVFRPWPATRRLTAPPAQGRDALAGYLRAVPRVSVPLDVPRRLAPLGGRSVLFRTAPAAAHRLDRIAAYRPEVVATLPDGFLELRLHL